jgi:hypothetical protein
MPYQPVPEEHCHQVAYENGDLGIRNIFQRLRNTGNQSDKLSLSTLAQELEYATSPYHVNGSRQSILAPFRSKHRIALHTSVVAQCKVGSCSYRDSYARFSDQEISHPPEYARYSINGMNNKGRISQKIDEIGYLVHSVIQHRNGGAELYLPAVFMSLTGIKANHRDEFQGVDEWDNGCISSNKIPRCATYNQSSSDC